jgi:hypothetical protein
LAILISLCSVWNNQIIETPLDKEVVLAMKVSNLHSDYPKLITELNKCENYGKWDCNKILDSNNKYSYGPLMYQKSTFLHYGHESGILPEWIDDTNFEKYICDRDIIVPIAEYMIKKELGPTTAGWQNCWYKYHLNKYL